MKRPHKLLKLETLLFASILLVTVGKQANGLRCYCLRENFPHSFDCVDNACTGDVCFLKRKLSYGAVTNQWGCINTSINPSWQNTCQLNRDDLAYSCCTSANNCNHNLTAYLPHEVPPPVASTTVQPSLSSSTQVTPTSTTSSSRPTVNINVEPVTTTPLPSPLAPKCYCNETASTPSQSCISKNYTCDAHSKCYARRYYDEGRGQIHMQWACLSAEMTYNVCSGGMNNEKSVYMCCNDSVLCNRYLQLVLPMEEDTTTATTSKTVTPGLSVSTLPTTSSDSISPSSKPGSFKRGVDIYIILSIVLVCLLIIIVVGVIAVLIYLYLRYQRQQATKAAVTAMSLKKRTTTKRHLPLNVGVIVNEVGHSYSSVPGKSKPLSRLIT